VIPNPNPCLKNPINQSRIQAIIPALIFLLLLFFSCKKEEELGVEVQPAGDELNISYTDTFFISAYTVRDDSVRTDETLINMVGCINDPVFGRTSAGAYTQFRLPDNNVNFGPNPVADSVILSLAYHAHYGDSTQPVMLNVFEVDKPFHIDSAYYAFTRLPCFKNDLASAFTFIPNYTDSVSVEGANQAPQLRVKLSKSLAEKFIAASGTASLSDNDQFANFFKGLYITVAQTGSKGQMIYFNLLSSASKLTLYYHNDNESLKYTFVLNDKCARINTFDHYNFLYADMGLKSQLAGDTLAGNQILYIQPMGGTRVKMKFPSLLSLVTNRKVAVNKAELVFKAEKSDPGEKLPDKMTLVRIKENGSLGFLPDALMGDQYFGGTLNSSDEYRFNIAKYIQEYLLQGGLGDIGLYITVSGASVKANSAVIAGHQAASGNLRLELTYTHIN
jgi:hypothetical protein